MRTLFPLPCSCCGAIFTLCFCVTAAQAGPCTGQIADVEQQIGAAAAASPPGGPGDASAPQTVGAQLHRQPTPGAVEDAEGRANADGDAALSRARQADAAGNADACAEALREVKQLYGID